jgi:hypothetical protein
MGFSNKFCEKKYLTNQTIGKVHKKPSDLHFWTGSMIAKPDFLWYGSFQIKNGEQIRFLEDKWLGNYSFEHQYPTLYNIVRRKNDTISKVLSAVPLSISFRRYLSGNNLILWNNLVGRIAQVQLVDTEDVFRWDLHQSGQFFIHSMYQALINNGLVPTNNKIWKVWIPLKIKIFMWYLYKGVVLTKGNLAKRNWNGSKQCSFCCKEESIQHLFFDCYYAKFMWGLIQITFGIWPPHNIIHLFGIWVNSFHRTLKRQLLAGALAFYWAIWLSRNDIIFDKTPTKTFL